MKCCQAFPLPTPVQLRWQLVFVKIPQCGSAGKVFQAMQMALDLQIPKDEGQKS